MNRTVCSADKCTGCMACVEICPKSAITITDEMDSIAAIIDTKKCIECKQCYNVCPNLHAVIKNAPQMWFQGWTNSNMIRQNSSSGGIAAAITKSFIEQGGYVCSCKYSQGEFRFFITNDIEEAKKFAGSKYVKSNPVLAYRGVKELIKKEKSVLFIGLPCQVAGLRNYLKNEDQTRLYCVDLICHGTPSIKTLKLYLKQNGIDTKRLDDIKFRDNDGYGLRVKPLYYKGVVDKYMLSFLNALTFTEGCYYCQYASENRVADITLGDNWGTELQEELSNGVSLILCMNNKGKKLLDNSNITLLDVDIEKAKLVNGQLSKPSSIPLRRSDFFCSIKKGKSFNIAVTKILPKQCLRQFIKGLAIKMGIMKR